MLIFQRKPFEEISSAVGEKNSILVLGCGTCPSVRLAGGDREVKLLATQLRLSVAPRKVEIIELTLKRQCDPEFFEEAKEIAESVELILSLACGMGVQQTENYLGKPAFPVNNTLFIGTLSLEEAKWLEYCRACGECVVHQYAGICPIARCAKGLLNGPCGGSQEGKCEVSPETPCAWQLIYDRLAARGELNLLEEIKEPKDWSKKSVPGQLIREDLSLGEESE